MNKKSNRQVPHSMPAGKYVSGVFLIIYIILSLLLFDPKLFTGGDNAIYILLAESLITGRGYRNIHLPEESPHTQYPIGFPLLLSSIMLIVGTNIIVLKFLILLIGAGSIYLLSKICEEIFKERAFIIMSLCVSIPIFIIYNHWILSEIPFLFFSMAALYCLMEAETKKKPVLYYASFGLATCSFFIRTAGISLIFGIVLFLLLRRRFRYLGIFLVIFLIFFLPWQIRNLHLPGTGSYLDQFLARNPYQMELGRIGIAELLTRVADNFIFYAFTILPNTILPIVQSRLWSILIGTFFVILAIIGFVGRMRAITIFESYAIFGIGILLMWPKVWSSDRFLLPILPIILIYVYIALFTIAERIGSKFLIPVLTGLFVIVNLLSIASLARVAIRNNIAYLRGNRYAGYMADWQRYFEMIDLVKKNVPSDRLIMARKPEFVYLLSRHKSFLYPFSTDHAEVRSAITRADYIIFDNFYWTNTTQRYLWPVLKEKPETYEIVYQTKKPNFYLLRVKK